MAAKFTTAPQLLADASTRIVAGTTITGGTPTTVTVKLDVAVLPAASVTTNVFVVVPNGNVEPLGKPAVCSVVTPPTLSVPIGAV